MWQRRLLHVDQRRSELRSRRAGGHRLRAVRIRGDRSASFAAGNQGTRKSINGGAEWTSTDIGATYSLSVALGDSLDSVVVTGTSKGIARSVNSGTSYTYVSSDYVGSLLSDPTMPTRVIAGLACGASSDGAQSSGGFRVSTDGGASFGGVKAQTMNRGAQ